MVKDRCELYTEINTKYTKKKKIQENKLDIVTQCNMKITWSITWTLHSTWIIRILSLTTDLIMLYTHKESNHAPSILEQTPTSTENRISVFSSSKTMSNEPKKIYQKALKKHRLSSNFEVSRCKWKCQQQQIK